MAKINPFIKYKAGLNSHYAAGIFTRAFYSLAVASEWNTKKAFDVMVRANHYYWTDKMSFQEGACAVLKAGQDLKYPLSPIRDAFASVGINTDICSLSER
ncbi:MAG: M4 family metallopeptidase [Gammaproteobacteria bacterium]|nr:M4 family metallopeptidase [Gammaproteobacteria bacterium]